MRHPTDGILRRLVDEPAGVADADRRHVASCSTCLAALTTAREDAAAASTALGADAAVDVDAAWLRLSHAMTADERRAAPAPPGPSRWRAALRSPAVAGVGVLALLTGASAAAAADWLEIFRAERVAPVTITQADLIALPDLSDYGQVMVLEQPDVRRVDDAAAAEEASGLDVPRVSELPQGVTGEPVYQVGGEASAVFTFSAEEAVETLGADLPAPPPGLDGSRFLLEAGPGVAAVWSSGSGAPALLVGRAAAPTVSSSGVPFETARDYLLSLPGLPDDLAEQLRSISGEGDALPLPVPEDLATTRTADVDGVPATVLAAQDGTLAAVVWVDDGVVNAVAGSMSDDEVLSVARGLE
ncbi:MAG: hypothetical protein ACLGIG_11995 [Actinomycetes bacterium]